jgi:hypothetical protein
LPICQTEVSKHYRANYSTIFFDFQSTLLSFAGDADGVFRSTQGLVLPAPALGAGTAGCHPYRIDRPNRALAARYRKPAMTSVLGRDGHAFVASNKPVFGATWSRQLKAAILPLQKNKICGISSVNSKSVCEPTPIHFGLKISRSWSANQKMAPV